jgi:hypothetical protein
VAEKIAESLPSIKSMALAKCAMGKLAKKKNSKSLSSTR